jgi:hypothetical protein
MPCSHLSYSACMGPPTKQGPSTSEVIGRLSNYLERLFGDASERWKDRVAERMADRVTEKVVARMAEMDARIATLEILADEEALDDLNASSRDSDSDLRDYDEIRREVGLA